MVAAAFSQQLTQVRGAESYTCRGRRRVRRCRGNGLGALAQQIVNARATDTCRQFCEARLVNKVEGVAEAAPAAQLLERGRVWRRVEVTAHEHRMRGRCAMRAVRGAQALEHVDRLVCLGQAGLPTQGLES